MIDIRPVASADISSVARINVDVWRTTYRGLVPDAFLAGLDYRQAEERWERFLQRPGAIALVAELEGSVVGYVMAGRERSGNEHYTGEIYAIYIRDEHQGHGIGRALLLATSTALRLAGMESLLVWVLDGNPAVEFYRKCGGLFVARKQIEIGGAIVDETAYGWAQMPGAR